ncbi:MAG TPA: Gfo/Idh/MocA family oxidoreductase [Thermoanaerobacterales bacterium]|jgi:predicted dehydrogenase|nr:Gfo/Idh/MocA family oxidoreductase [Thermoanaerobacterales bacterium]
METCNVGIIGLGGFARLISTAIKESEKVRIIAGADTDAGRIEKFKEETGIEKAHYNAAELLPDPEIDIVIIAAPPAYHYDLGRLSLSSGKHVFFEKPGALAPEDMLKLIKLTETNKVKASIDFVMRRNPLYFILKELCNKNIFGLPERAYLENYAHDDSLPPEHWFWDYEKSGGIWLEHGVHFFDLANWLLGLPKGAYGKKIPRDNTGIIDRVLGTAYHDNNAVVSYYHGFTKPEAFENTSFSLIFERAYVKADGWIPIKLTVDAMINPEVEKYMMKDLLMKARSYLPDIDITLETKLKNSWDGARTFMGRGKEYRATARVMFTYQLSKDRWEVYRACVRQGIEDLALAVKDKKTEPDVTLHDAKKALDVAFMMEGK